MKLSLLLITALLLLTVSSRNAPIDQQFGITVEELESYLMGFLYGLHIEKYANATLDWKENFDEFLRHGFETYAEFENGKYYDGILSLADTLGESSPLARNCTTTTDQILLGIHNYIHSYTSFREWITTVEANVWSNFVRISLVTNELVAEIDKKNTNYTLVFQLVGEVIFYSVDANQTEAALKYTKTDPLAPAPLNENLFVAFESVYEFLSQSKIVLEPTIGSCEGNIISLVLYETDGYNNVLAKNTEEGIMLILDSFTFLHDIIVNCTDAGTQAFTNGTNVYNKIAANPDVILDNFKANVFQVISGSAASYAQIYHKDVISLFKTFGDVVYQTLVEENV